MGVTGKGGGLVGDLSHAFAVKLKRVAARAHSDMSHVLHEYNMYAYE